MLITRPTRRSFGPVRDTNLEWRRLHNEQLRSLHRSPDLVRVIQSRRLKWADRVTIMDEGKSAFKILTGESREKIRLGRPRRRLMDIKMDLKEIGINTRNLADSVQDGD